MGNSEPAIRQAIASLLVQQRESRGTQATILDAISSAGGSGKSRSTLSRIESGQHGIPLEDLFAFAEAYQLDPHFLFAAQALAELQDALLDKNTREVAPKHKHAFLSVLHQTLASLKCLSIEDLLDRMRLPVARRETYRLALRANALQKPLLRPWVRETGESAHLPKPRLVQLNGPYTEIGFDEFLAQTRKDPSVPIVIHGTRSEGVGLIVASLLRPTDVEQSSCIDLLLLDARSVCGNGDLFEDAVRKELVGNTPSNREWLDELLTGKLRIGSEMWLVFDYCAEAFDKLAVYSFIERAHGIFGAATRYIFVFDRSVRFNHTNQNVPNARHYSLAPLRPEDVIEAIQQIDLTVDSAFIDHPAALVLRRHLWLYALVSRARSPGSTRINLNQVDVRSLVHDLHQQVCTTVLDAEAYQSCPDTSVIGKLRHRMQGANGDLRLDDAEKQLWFLSLGLPDPARSITPPDLTGVDFVRTDRTRDDPSIKAKLVVENTSTGSALANIVSSELWDGGIPSRVRPHVHLCEYDAIPAELETADFIICPHYSYFRYLGDTKRLAPLNAKAGQALSSKHMPFARMLCSSDGTWWGLPFQYPTKLACYRPKYFRHGIPRTAEELQQSLGRGHTAGKILFQLERNHPSLYYEWLSFVQSAGGADVILDPLYGPQVLIDSESTIHATELFKSLIGSAFCHKDSSTTNWLNIDKRIADTSVAIAFPFNDLVPSIMAKIRDSDLTRDGHTSGNEAEPDIVSWSTFKLRSYSNDIDHSSVCLFGSRSAPLHVSTIHVFACVNSKRADEASEFALWLLDSGFQADFASLTVMSPLAGTLRSPSPKFGSSLHSKARGEAWDANVMAQRHLNPILPKSKWDYSNTATPPIRLSDGQEEVLRAIGQIIDEGDPPREVLSAAGKKLRDMIGLAQS